MNSVIRCLFIVGMMFCSSLLYGQGGVVSVKSNVVIVPEAGRVGDVVRAYSVRIFSDNSQSARSKSETVEKEFKDKYRGVPVDVSYDAPYFKVTVGKFLSKEEAIMLWGSLLAEYPTAFVVPIEMKIEENVELRPLSYVGGEIELGSN